MGKGRGSTMRLRKPCQHDLYDKHYIGPANFADRMCPGGEFLTDDTLLLDPEIQHLAFAILDGQRINIPYDLAAEWLARAVYQPDALTVREGAE